MVEFQVQNLTLTRALYIIETTSLATDWYSECIVQSVEQSDDMKQNKP